MIGTIALLGTLLATPQMDKISFTHVFTAGQTVVYDLNLLGGEQMGNMEINTTISMLIGEKVEKGTNITLTPKSMKMSMNGQEHDGGTEFDSTKFILDKNGMPDTIKMGGDTSILTIPLVLCFLPDKELEVGETFYIDFKIGEATYKGSGKFEGMETVNDQSFPKLTIKANLQTPGDKDASLNYSVNFDNKEGRVVLVKGTYSDEEQEFKLTLTKKKASP